MPKKRAARVEIIRGRNGVVPSKLRINGRLVKAPQQQIAVLGCLHDEIGFLVPNKRLCLALGHPAVNRKTKHLLRQYIGAVKQILQKGDAGCVVATVRGAGYVLCHVRAPRRGQGRASRSRS